MAVIILKAVEKCNSNCLYCNVIKKHQDICMPVQFLEVIFDRINEFLTKQPDRTIHLTWHGGEVCLLGPDFFRHMLEYQQKTCAQTGNRIQHLIQSNLTLITQEMLDIFKSMGVKHIGSSFEPLPDIRGFGVTRDSTAYNRQFFNGVRLLEQNGFKWGVIYVVHKHSLASPLELFHYLTNLNLTVGPNFNPVLLFGDEKNGNLSITPVEYARFLGTIFEYWWERRTRYPVVRPLTQYENCFSSKENHIVCGHSGQCANNWVYIGPDGNTSQCGASGDSSYMSYGSIKNRSLEDILYDSQRDVFLERQKRLQHEECSDCRFWGVCHGGCPMEAALLSGNIMTRSPYCETTKILMEEYFEPAIGRLLTMKP